jgi:hypothetical protein
MLGCCCGSGGGEARRRAEVGEAGSWPHTRMWCVQSFFWHVGEQYGTFLPTSRHFEHILHTTNQPMIIRTRHTTHDTRHTTNDTTQHEVRYG